MRARTSGSGSVPCRPVGPISSQWMPATSTPVAAEASRISCFCSSVMFRTRSLSVKGEISMPSKPSSAAASNCLRMVHFSLSS